MFPLLPLYALRSILQKNREEQFRESESDTKRRSGLPEGRELKDEELNFTQKLRSKFGHISNRLNRTPEIVALLFQSRVLTSKEKDDIQDLSSTPIKASEQLLNTLMLKDKEAYEGFLKALDNTDQKHIATMLKREDIIHSENEHSQLIRRNYVPLLENLDVSSRRLLDCLYSSHILNERELETINAKPTKHEKNEILLTFVSNFTSAGFKKFLQALIDDGQEHVADIMTGKRYANIESSVFSLVESNSHLKDSGLHEGSQKTQELQSAQNRVLRLKHQEKIIIQTSSRVLTRAPIKTLGNTFAILPDELQMGLSLKVASLHQKTVLPDGANLEICFRKLIQDFIQQKEQEKTKQSDVEEIREVLRKATDSAQNLSRQFVDIFNAKTEMFNREKNFHFEEMLKATAIELHSEKKKCKGLEGQLQQNQNESENLRQQRDAIRRELYEALKLVDESKNPAFLPMGREYVFDLYPELLHVQSLEDRKDEQSVISGLVVLDKELFVAFEHKSEVKVFQAITFEPLRSITVTDLDNSLDMVSMDGALYISSPKEMYRVDASGKAVGKWTIEDGGGTLSVTHDQTVLLSVWKRTALREYSAEGALMSELRLPSDFHPFHAVKTNVDQFVVSFEDRMVHKVAKFHVNGTIIQSFGGMLKFPKYLAVNSYGYIFVADQKNSRVLMMNVNLKSCKVLLEKDNLVRPLRIYLDEKNSRMFVVDIKTGDQKFMVFRLSKHKPGVNEEAAATKVRPDVGSNHNLKDSGGIEHNSDVVSIDSDNEEEEDEFIEAKENLDVTKENLDETENLDEEENLDETENLDESRGKKRKR